MTTPGADLDTVLGEAGDRLLARLEGLTSAEYAWEPAPGAAGVREVGGRWLADVVDEDASPAPLTTIAWRLHHLASDCFGSYLVGGLGAWPLTVTGREWHGDPAAAVHDLDIALTAFRTALLGLGEEGLRRPLGPAWGPFGDASWLGLGLHALDELAHHGGEVALLRDLALHVVPGLASVAVADPGAGQL